MDSTSLHDERLGRASIGRRFIGFGALAGLVGAMLGRGSREAEAGHAGGDVFHLGTGIVNVSGPAAVRFSSSTAPAIRGENPASGGAGLEGLATNISSGVASVGVRGR